MMPDLHRGPPVRGAICPGDYTDDGAVGLDSEKVERDWVAGFPIESAQVVLVALRVLIEAADSEMDTDQLDDVELRNLILRFIDELEAGWL